MWNRLGRRRPSVQLAVIKDSISNATGVVESESFYVPLPDTIEIWHFHGIVAVLFIMPFSNLGGCWVTLV